MMAVQSEAPFAADAAAEALADSGALAAARNRVESGDASDADDALLAYVTAQEAVPA
jgi:hypothetical protein